ncbi:hypothetical protein [Candidatus Hodgkinia cicadicola]|uniref:hypothetical protein n=1 Tax=Candidatus Hodgkinia cicadicola TaxID=573658 RepID=UPI001788D859
MLDVGLMGWIGLIVRVCCNFMIIGITLLGVGLIGGNWWRFGIRFRWDRCLHVGVEDWD